MNPDNTPVPSGAPQPITPTPEQSPVPAASPAVPQANPVPAPPTVPLPAPASSPQAGPVMQPIQGGSSQAPIIIAVIVGLVVALGALGFVGTKIFSSKSKQSPIVSTPPAALDASLTGAQEESKAREQQAVVPKGVTELKDKTIVDPEMGYTITAKSMAIGDFAVKGSSSFAEGKTTVAVEFINKDSNKYSGSAKNVMLSLLNSESITCMDQTTQYKAEMTAKGMVALTDAKEQADTVTGWNVYACESESINQLTLKYKRFAANVIGGKQTIPAKDFTIQLR